MRKFHVAFKKGQIYWSQQRFRDRESEREREGERENMCLRYFNP